MDGSFEERLARFPELSDEDRSDLLAEAEGDSLRTDLVREAEQLFALGRAAGKMSGSSLPDEALAYWLATPRTGHAPRWLAEAFNRIEQRLAQDDEARRRLQVMRSRLDTWNRESAPADQFERLSGHRLDAQDDEATSDRVSEANVVPLRLRRVVSAAVGMVAAYLLLWSLSAALQSDAMRWVSGESDRVRAIGVTARSEAGEAASSLELEKGRRWMDRGRRSFLGLFSTYSGAALDSAAAAFASVLESSDRQSPEYEQAAYRLGVVRWLEGDENRARAAFSDVVAVDGPLRSRADEALRRLSR